MGRKPQGLPKTEMEMRESTPTFYPQGACPVSAVTRRLPLALTFRASQGRTLTPQGVSSVPMPSALLSRTQEPLGSGLGLGAAP